MSIVYLEWATLLAWSTNTITSLLFTQFITWAPNCPQWWEVPLFPKASPNHSTLAGTLGTQFKEDRSCCKKPERERKLGGVTSPLMPWLGSLPREVTGGPAHSDGRKFVHVYYNTTIDSALFFPSPQQHPPELWGRFSFRSRSHAQP